MKKLSEKIWLVFSIMFFAVAVSGFFFLYFDLDKKNKKLVEDVASWEKEATHRENLKSLSYFLESYENELEEFDKHFIVSGDVVPFLNHIENLGRNVSVDPTISGVEVSKDKTMLLVDVKTSGSFENIYRFITLVENSPFEIELLRSNLSSAGGQVVSEWTGSFTLGLKSFLSKE